jgi:hypothetical protein
MRPTFIQHPRLSDYTEEAGAGQALDAGGHGVEGYTIRRQRWR